MFPVCQKSHTDTHSRSHRHFTHQCVPGAPRCLFTVHRVPEIAWERIVESLSRGDNVEESHYMERMWVGSTAHSTTHAE